MNSAFTAAASDPKWRTVILVDTSVWVDFFRGADRAADLAELRAWFEEFAAEEWDPQIEEDARNGKLDALYQRFEKENQHDGDVPLDDFINKEKLP